MNVTGICEECISGYHTNGNFCQINCQPGQAWVPVNECEDCIEGCTSCTNVTKVCTECGDGFWLDPSNTCKLSCDQGPFTDLSHPEYEAEILKNYKAWIPPNNCQGCNVGCQKCSNVTLTCEDILIKMKVEQSNLEFTFNQIELNVEFFDMAGLAFQPPNTVDYTYFLKIIDLIPDKENI